MATDVLSLPKDQSAARTYVLPDEIPALQLIGTENGHARWGPLVRLPSGAELHDFGEGFDGQTLRVRFDGSFYIIFQQDLDTAQQSATQRKRARNL